MTAARLVCDDGGMDEARRKYMREYQAKRRKADPVTALEASRKAYAARKAKEAVDPALRERREALQKAWSDAHLEQRAAYTRKAYDKIRSTPRLLEEHRLTGIEYMRRYKLDPRHAIKLRARWRASKALRTGRLMRQPCEVCGSPKVEMHHPDYSKALDVRWLCKAHHEAAHAEATT